MVELVVWQDDDAVLTRSADEPENGLLVLTAAGPQTLLADRFRHALRLAGRISPAWGAQPVALEGTVERAQLTMRDPGGELLARLVGQPWPTARFLRGAIALAEALRRMHAAAIVHKDIKPSHILLDEARDQAWFCGFFLASVLSDSAEVVAPRATPAGTLAYMAPEQSGRMNRAVDGRSDLYALGVTLYQMLAGKLPFSASDPLGWIHCHVARIPPAPEEAIGQPPGMLSAIIMKLLAKAAEERYQSAAALSADLHCCLESWERSGAIEPFALAAHEVSGQLRFRQKPYGRESELALLRDALTQARGQDEPAMVMIAGYSGSGKSALVGEFARRSAAHCLFSAGKFDQARRDIPYATLVQICEGLVAHLLRYDDPATVQALQLAVGEHAALLVHIVPELSALLRAPAFASKVIAEQSPPDMQLLFCRLLQVFAQPGRPLVLFLDDLQWVDLATLNWLESLAGTTALRHVLLIGAYRDNEVQPGHALDAALARLRAQRGAPREIVMAPLTPEMVCTMLCDTLDCAPAQAEPLAALISGKTGGNPFFVIWFLHSLIDDGLLSAGPNGSGWGWDLRLIEAQAYTANVVELMTGKLARLSAPSREALSSFACLGHVAPLALIAKALAVSAEAADVALCEATAFGLLQRQDGGYAFSHDRVQEVAYDLNPPAQRPFIHLGIARALLKGLGPAALEEASFDIANQVNRASSLPLDGEDRLDFARINLVAGNRARAATAHAAARAYFSAGCGLIGAGGWEQDFALMFDLELRLAEAEFLAGAMEPAEARMAMLAARARSLQDKATVAWLTVTLLTARGQLDRAIGTGLAYLREVGVDWSPAPRREAVMEEYAPIGARIAAGKIDRLLALPALDDVERNATLNVLIALVPPAFFTDQNLVCLLLCRITNLSIKYGNSDASALGYAYLGMMLGPYFGQYEAGYCFGQLGNCLVESGQYERFKARVHMCFAYHVMPWTRHLRTGLPLLRRAFDEACEAGDLTYSGFSSCSLITTMLASGAELGEVERLAAGKLDYIRRSKFGLIATIISTQLQLVRSLRGVTPSLGAFGEAGFDEADFERALGADTGLTIARCWYWIRQTQLRYLAGNHAGAVAAAEVARPLLWTTSGHLEMAEYHVYAALARAACTVAPADCADQLVAVGQHLHQLQTWSNSGPASFSCRASLVEGERARLDGQPTAALQAFEAAMVQARQQGFPHIEAIAAELAGKLCASLRLDTPAQIYLRQARQAYQVWGAAGKVRSLDAAWPGLNGDALAVAQAAALTAHLDQIDLDTVMRTSEAISAQVGLDRLVATLMLLVLEQSGAERALLILPRDGRLWLAGEAATRAADMDVQRRDRLLDPAEAPHTMLHEVMRRGSAIVVDNAQKENRFSDDQYFSSAAGRSVYCLPLLKQTRVIGLLYLENSLASHVFTAARQGLLNLLGSQAAVSLENAALEENRALLKEVHHRVKNNLQLISSLLSLQSAQVADPAVAELFNESRNRVRTMALMHENLYRSGSYARVPMAEHVHLLCRQLIRAYGMPAQHIALSAEADDIRLDLNRAVSCGLLINELVTNALKHAFPAGEGGAVTIALRQHGARCRLTVSDNGSGIAASDESGSLGLLLIHDLSDQLHGSLDIATGAGTVVTIDFPLDGADEAAS